MSQTLNVHDTTSAEDTTADSLKVLYGPIRAELQQVEEILQNELRSRHPYVDELVRYGCMLGGKRLRPALLLLAARASGGEINRQHLVLAAVIEMIHTATLIHDDVLDDANQRRHLATVNARWNVESSVLLGDYLFTHAFYLASTLESTAACRLIGRTTNTVCEGELRQIGNRGVFSLSEDEYLDIIEAKTAALCSCCCRLGAVYAGVDTPAVEALAKYGTYVGIAFQIADDLLDIRGDESTTGKSLGSDLEKQKATLPLIRVLQQASDEQRSELLNLLESGNGASRELLSPWFEQFDALTYAQNKASQYAELARQQLDGLPPSESRSILQLITEFVVLRSR